MEPKGRTTKLVAIFIPKQVEKQTSHPSANIGQGEEVRV